MSWAEWSGELQQSTGINFIGGPAIRGAGGIVAVEFACDLGLDDLEAPGKLGQYMLQVTAQCTNISPIAIIPTMYIIVVSEGTFTIEGLGKACTNLGVISSQDILNCKSNPFYNYNDVQNVNGGNFWDSLKNIGSRVYRTLKEHGPEILSLVKKTIPELGLGQVHCNICKGKGHKKHIKCHHCKGSGVMVAGNGGVSMAGVLLGGKHMTKDKLHKRLQHYQI
jgi:hypothetical protein